MLRPKTIDKLTSALAIFGEFLTTEFPELGIDRQARTPPHRSVPGLDRDPHLSQATTADRPVGPFVTAHAAISVRGFLDDITAWGWAEAPARRLMFASDIPKQPTMLPRALAPDVDTALMAAVAELDDLFARVGLTVLRGTGLRIGELLELELDAVVDYGPAGTWLRVPLGKLNNERIVPLDATTLAAFDEWLAHRRHQRALPHPRDGRPDRLRVRREPAAASGPGRIQQGLRDAVRAAGLTGPDGQPLRIVAHQLRHTYATTLVNAGMSLQALMTLLGHSSPEMTIRYAQLASPTLRSRLRPGDRQDPPPHPRRPRPAATPSRTTSSGCGPRCSRPASPTATAPATSRTEADASAFSSGRRRTGGRPSQGGSLRPRPWQRL